MSKESRPNMVCQGQLYDVELPVSVGSVQDGVRPVIITSANRRNRTSPTIIVAVVTSRLKRLDLPEHVLLPKIEGLPKESMVCAEQRFTVDKTQLGKYRGKLPWHVWCQVHRAIRQSERTYKADYEKSNL